MIDQYIHHLKMQISTNIGKVQKITYDDFFDNGTYYNGHESVQKLYLMVW